MVVQVCVDGQKYDLEDRLAEIVLGTLDCAEQITASEKIAVTFDCAGPKVSMELKERRDLTRRCVR